MENKYSKSFVQLQTRNIRYLFIVKHDSEIRDLLELCYKNQRFWGGRYNPIIPSVNGKISEEYIKLAALFDPDYIIYPDSLNLDLLKPYFNPIEYIKSSSFHRNLKGLESNYLLTNGRFDTLLFTQTHSFYKLFPELHSFYQLNFDFMEGREDEHFFRFFEKVRIDKNNKDKLDEIIDSGMTFFQSLLARVRVKHISINKKEVLNRIELIISDDDNQLNDLLYYWNRQLYLRPSAISINQIYITKSQLDRFLELCKVDSIFASLSGTTDISISSLSLSKAELKLIKDNLNTWQGCISFFVNENISFPFIVENVNTVDNEYSETNYKQTLIGKTDLIQLPKLSFVNESNISGQWIVDLSIKRDHDYHKNEILLPLNTNFRTLFCNKEGRINKENRLSLIVSSSDISLDFKIPTDEEIFRTIFLLPTSGSKNKLFNIETGSDGLKLSSLLTLFDFDYHNISRFFEDKFWLGIFGNKNIDKTKSDKIRSSKGIVSMKDLESEYQIMFESELVKFNPKFFESDFNELFDCLNDLVGIDGYFIGQKISCRNCGSSLWYSLSELNNLMSCKGCFQKITPRIEATYYYKLNDVIKNCMISNSGSSKDVHGNLTVLKTLLSKERHSIKSFYLLPSQNYYLSHHSKTPHSDIDIICVSDGNLIIGEAKNSVKEFTTEVIENLIKIGDIIEPDELLLAFSEGDKKDLDKKIEKIKASLKNKNIKVTSHKVWESSYMSTNLAHSKSPRAAK